MRPQRFSQRWSNAVNYRDPVDPTTGRVNQKSFIQIVQAVHEQLRGRYWQYRLYRIIEKDVYYEQGLNRVRGLTALPASRRFKAPGWRYHRF